MYVNIAYYYSSRFKLKNQSEKNTWANFFFEATVLKSMNEFYSIYIWICKQILLMSRAIYYCVIMLSMIEGSTGKTPFRMRVFDPR